MFLVVSPGTPVQQEMINFGSVNTPKTFMKMQGFTKSSYPTIIAIC